METSNKGSYREETPIHELFYNLYRGLHRAYGQFTIFDAPEGAKREGRAATINGPYTSELWRRHLAGRQGLGVIPIDDTGQCFWGAIDVDIYPLDLIELEEKIRTQNLPFIVLRSKSGGAHLTMFFGEPVSCKDVRATLYDYALQLGYGTCEIFPKQIALASQEEIGNWLNMPYFDAANTNRYAIHEGMPLSVFEFLALASRKRLTKEQFKNLRHKKVDDFRDGPACLQCMVNEGGVDSGGRNEALYAMATYCKKKYGKEDLDVRVVELNDKYMIPPLSKKEVTSVVNSVRKTDKSYNCSHHPLVERCNKDTCYQRKYGARDSTGNLGYDILRLQKITTDPVTWKAWLSPEIVVSATTTQLTTQQLFRVIVSEAMNFIPKLIKQFDWDAYINGKMHEAEIIEAPGETRLGERLKLILSAFKAVTQEADALEDMRQGRTYIDEKGVTFFYGHDFAEHIQRNGIMISMRDMWGALHSQGAVSEEFVINGTKTTLWGMRISVKGHKVNKEEFSGPAF